MTGRIKRTSWWKIQCLLIDSSISLNEHNIMISKTDEFNNIFMECRTWKGSSQNITWTGDFLKTIYYGRRGKTWSLIKIDEAIYPRVKSWEFGDRKPCQNKTQQKLLGYAPLTKCINKTMVSSFPSKQASGGPASRNSKRKAIRRFVAMKKSDQSAAKHDSKFIPQRRRTQMQLAWHQKSVRQTCK